MSITLPDWAVETADWLDFEWPDIDEDELGEAADALWSYARACDNATDTTSRVVIDLAPAYQAPSYLALRASWDVRLTPHMREIIVNCLWLKGELDATADAVEEMKRDCLAELRVAKAHRDGAGPRPGEASGPGEAFRPLHRHRLEGSVRRFEEETGRPLVSGVIDPVEDRTTSAVKGLYMEEAPDKPYDDSMPGLHLNTDAMRIASKMITEQANGSLDAGSVLAMRVSGLTFSTGPGGTSGSLAYITQPVVEVLALIARMPPPAMDHAHRLTARRILSAAHAFDATEEDLAGRAPALAGAEGGRAGAEEGRVGAEGGRVGHAAPNDRAESAGRQVPPVARRQPDRVEPPPRERDKWRDIPTVPDPGRPPKDPGYDADTPTVPDPGRPPKDSGRDADIPAGPGPGYRPAPEKRPPGEAARPWDRPPVLPDPVPPVGAFPRPPRDPDDHDAPDRAKPEPGPGKPRRPRGR
ncbi:hypothetical protein EBN88_01705 [Streptomyces triticirhizae]|uniref:Uncharacterized protein n=2 Tax=Streptomyces triticirhizae TaxID=2483353 RepID=A0A3M2M879_9ACTN|nr:hypothetical protein EBN88_01705 [Streptomyces triticirhizae]